MIRLLGLVVVFEEACAVLILETGRSRPSFHSMSENPIPAVAVVLARLSPVTYRIALPNGKELVGHVSKALRDHPSDFEADDQVTLEMTPYDFSRARIVGLAGK